jgi:hypothetical protein
MERNIKSFWDQFGILGLLVGGCLGILLFVFIGVVKAIGFITSRI